MADSTRRPSLTAPLVSAGIPLIGVTCLDWAAVSSWGSESLLWIQMLFLIPLACALVLLLPCIIGLFFHATDRLARVCLLCSVAYLLGFIVSVPAGQCVRMHAFRSLADRSEPLVRAIDAYDSKYGHPPGSLSALVPEFMPRVPVTGMAAYPRYEYVAAHHDELVRGDRWELYINTPSGGIKMDRFVYWPRHDYPEYAYGGSVQRVGAWAYVHE